MSSLDQIPFLGGFMQMDAVNRGRESQQIKQVGDFMTLQGAMEDRGVKRAALEREAAMRQALQGLPPDADPDQVAAAVRPYAGASDLLRTSVSSADRRAKLESDNTNREAAREQREHELKERGRQSLAEIALRASEGRITKAEADERARQTRLEVVQAIAANRAPREAPAPIVQTADDGTTKLYDRAGNLIKDLGKTGKPSAQFQKVEQQKKQLGMDLTRAIGELEKATVEGGLIDKSTGSGAGALVDMAAGFVGKATPGAIAAGQIAPIYDLVLKMVPRFEGPQSDKDTASYERASGQLANPAIPNATKKEAAKEILRLMKDRKAQFVSKDMVSVDAPAAPGAPAGPKFLGFE